MKIKASTIAEVVIALTIIAVCFAVASQVFTQSNRSTVQFREVADQTDFQSRMIDALLNDTLPATKNGDAAISEISVEISAADSCEKYVYTLRSGERKTWQQELFYEK